MESLKVTPKEIFHALRQEIIGQDEVLKFVATSIFKHLQCEKLGNLLLIGNSGTGKTSIMKAVERFYHTTKGLEDFSIVARLNANVLFDEKEAFPGDVLFRTLKEMILTTLPPEQRALERIRTLMEKATICIDEIDKVSSILGEKPYPPGVAIQQSLLTVMEGETIFFELEWEGKKETLPIDTSKMLFICGGAFERLYDLVFYRAVVKEREQTTRLNIAEDGKVSFEYRFSLQDYMRQEDLFEYGMLPQFISRFDNILILNDLSEQDLQYIFAKPRDSLYQLSRKYFDRWGIELKITESAQKLIAREATRYRRIGARALKDVYGKVIKPFEFDPEASGLLKEKDGKKELLIDEEVVKKQLNLPREA